VKQKIGRYLKRYRVFLLLLLLNLALLFLFPDIGSKSFRLSWSNLLQMLSVLPPIFILLGLLDVWVKRESMIRFMGEGSGLTGVLLAFLMGSVAAGPLYAAFPIAAVMLKKGAKISNALIMLGAWSTTKIPMILFETSAMGLKFMLTRLLLDLPGIAVIAFVTNRALDGRERENIYRNAEDRA
jgi:uncharacterized membrane protein YraQ (UPF0718 family)